LKPAIVMHIVEKLAWYLRREGIYVASCEIRDHGSKYEAYFKLESNPAGLTRVKIIINKQSGKIRVYTGKTSFDLRVKRFIKRELERAAKGLEIASQEENKGSS